MASITDTFQETKNLDGAKEKPKSGPMGELLKEETPIPAFPDKKDFSTEYLSEGDRVDTPRVRPKKEVGESTWTDYWNTMNTSFIQMTNPELRSTLKDVGATLDWSDPKVNQLWEEADAEGKEVIEGSVSYEHALKRLGRRKVQKESLERINQDGIVENIALGLIPAVLDLPNAIPYGGITAKWVKLGQTASTMAKIGKGAAIGGGIGAVSNVVAEGVFDSQGMEPNYMNAAVLGFGFGGALGAVGGALEGVFGKQTAENLFKNDNIEDFEADKWFEVDMSDGVPKVTGLTEVGKISSWGPDSLRSDVHIAYGSDSQVLRNEMTKLSPPSFSLVNTKGDLITVGHTALDDRVITKGYHNTLRAVEQELYQDAVKNGYKGSYAGFFDEVSEVYTKAISEQQGKVWDIINTQTKDLKMQHRNTKKKVYKEIDQEYAYVPGDDGKLRPLGPEEQVMLNENRRSKEEYIAAVEHNKQVDIDIEAMLDQMEAEGKFTGSGKMAVKKKRAAAKKELEATMGESKVDIPKTWKPINPVHDGNVVVKQKPKKVRDAEKAEVSRQIDEELETAIREMENTVYDATPHSFKSDNPYVTKVAEANAEYYRKVRERGAAVGIEELSNIPNSKLYRPVAYDFNGIREKRFTAEEARAYLTEAFKSHPANKRILEKANGDELLEEAVDNIMKNFEDIEFSLNFLKNSYVSPKTLPFQKNLMAQKLKLDQSKLGPLLMDNINDVSYAYSYKMSGVISIQNGLNLEHYRKIAAEGSKDGKATMDDAIKAYMSEVREKMQEEGVDVNSKNIQDSMAAFERNIKDIVGDLRINAYSNTPMWKFSRGINAWQSSRLLGGSGGNQLIEMMSNIMIGGMTRMFTSGGFAKSFKDVFGMMFTGKHTTSMSKFVLSADLMDTALKDTRIDKFGQDGGLMSTNWFENSLRGLSNTMQKWNGMRPFQAAMESQTAARILEDIRYYAKQTSLSPADGKRLARLGLTLEEAKAIAKDIEAHVNIKEGKMDLSKFQQKNIERLQAATHRGVSQTVVQGDSIHTPNIFKNPEINGPIASMMTLFLRFPMTAHATLLEMGLREEKARMLAGIFASVGTYMMLKYAREQAAIQLGMIKERDTKYDYFNQRKATDAIKKGIEGGLSYSANLGLLANVANGVLLITGNEGLGSTFRGGSPIDALTGPTGSSLKDIVTTSQNVVQGEGNYRDMQRIMAQLPGATLPLWSETWRAVIKEMFK